MAERFFDCTVGSLNIETRLAKDRKCLLYGAGNKGMEVLEVLKKIGVEAVAFLDSMRPGPLAGLSVYRPDAIPAELKKYPVIVSVFSNPENCSLTCIIPFLESFGFHDIISYESFYCVYHEYFDEAERYWQSTPDYFRRHEKEIVSASEILADDASRDLFRRQIRFRLTGEAALLSPPSPVELQYFDPSVYSRRTFREFWDLGAFTGDTLACAAAAGKEFRKVVAFEPDMRNYTRLCRYLEAHRGDYDSATALPLAVGEENETLRFMECASTSSAISGTGNASVPSVSPDSAFIGAAPDFIKMDIEGSEYSALKGMRNILLKNRPLLAVCVYHLPEDIWRIPLFLHGLLENYSWYLRCYSAHLFDTVLYAVPRGVDQ